MGLKQMVIGRDDSKSLALAFPKKRFLKNATDGQKYLT